MLLLIPFTSPVDSLCGDYNEFSGVLPNGRRGAPVIKSLKSIAVDVDHFKRDFHLDMTIEGFLNYHKKVEDIILVIKRTFAKVPVTANLEFIELENSKEETAATVAKEIEKCLDILEEEAQERVLARNIYRTHEWVPSRAWLAGYDAHGSKAGKWVEREEPLDVEETVEEEFIRPVVRVVGIAKGGVRL